MSAIYGGLFMAEDYWDYKLLIANLLIFSLPFTVFIYNDTDILTKTLKTWLKYALFLYILLIPFLEGDAHGRYLTPLTLLALLFFDIRIKYKIIVVIGYIWILIMGIDSRSDVSKYTVCLLLSLFYLLRNKKRISVILKTIHVLLLIAPIILFILGITGAFNIFKIEEFLTKEYTLKSSTGEEFSAMGDSRTFLYFEEIQSAVKNKYVLQGRSIARGYDSPFFGEEADGAMNRARGERQSCETSILNAFNYFGIVGVILYFGIFMRASYIAIYKSNNIYIKIIGLYVAFRWLFAWIEDFNRVDLNYLFLWIFVGMCFSEPFRKMNNIKFRCWIKSI
jgi:hypothetical protein